MNVVAYGEGEALGGMITSGEFLRRFMPELLELAMNPERAVEEVKQLAHEAAARLNLTHSPGGAYPPVVYELAAASI